MFLAVSFFSSPPAHRSSSTFQRSLSGASPGPGSAATSGPLSSLPYSIKQETRNPGRRLPAAPQDGFPNCRLAHEMGGVVATPQDASVSGSCAGGALSANAAQPFNSHEADSSLPALSPPGSRHSTRLLGTAGLKRHSSQSAATAATASPSSTEEINITAIICSSSTSCQMSMVARLNGFRTELPSPGFSSSSPCSSSSPPSAPCRERPPPRRSPQQAALLQERCQLSSPAATCLLSTSSSSSSSCASSVSSLEPEQGPNQGLCNNQAAMLQVRGSAAAAVGGSEGLGLLSLMSGMLHSAPDGGGLLDQRGGGGGALKQEPLDDFSPSEDELFHPHHHYHHQQHRVGGGHGGRLRPPHQHLSRPTMPPPYHLHQYTGPSHGGLLHHQSHQTATNSSLGLKATGSSPPGAPSAAEREEAAAGGGGGGSLSDKQMCRWIDCSAAYEQQEELVRHIEKVHIDQRKGEDFTCFWAGCIRRYKPFNARYKLLIHMRVHSGEKPNKCMVSRTESSSQQWHLIALGSLQQW